MPVKIMRCTCENKFQDAKYGKGKRVHNLDADGKEACCTVCGYEDGKRKMKKA